VFISYAQRLWIEACKLEPRWRHLNPAVLPSGTGGRPASRVPGHTGISSMANGLPLYFQTQLSFCKELRISTMSSYAHSVWYFVK
jgi:hypothetical protein